MYIGLTLTGDIRSVGLGEIEQLGLLKRLLDVRGATTPSHWRMMGIYSYSLVWGLRKLVAQPGAERSSVKLTRDNVR